MIYLLTATYKQDNLQQVLKSYDKHKVFANKFSISKMEFSAAGQLGLKPDVAYQVLTSEYAGEEFVEIDGLRYHVYRSQENGDKTVLYLQREVADDGV
ncbi:phage head closure protein [Lactovum odontotermitis]